MQNFSLIRILWRSRRPNLLPKSCKGQAGFTLVELLVTVIMVGVIAAIAAPSWLSFVQQRRVAAANDAVARVLQEAQSLAKSQKLSYSVSFRNQGGVPQVAVYKDSPQPDASSWRALGDQFGFKSGQIILGTNLANGVTNSAGGSVSYNLPTTSSVAKITFNYTGAFPTTPNPNLGSQGLIIAVAAGKPNSNPPEPASTQRCVKVSTLLGSTQIGKIRSGGGVDQCQPN